MDVKVEEEDEEDDGIECDPVGEYDRVVALHEEQLSRMEADDYELSLLKGGKM